MHFSYLFTIASLVVSGINAAAALKRADLDPTLCYSLTTDSDLQNYLDSASSVIDVENHPDRTSLINAKDKGVTFRFPEGEGGPVVCQAHNGHFVGIVGDVFRTDVDGSNVGRINVLSSGDGVSLQNGETFVGIDGLPSTDAFSWFIEEIPCIVT